ncbi:hypothetical protein C8R46DRAFT_1351275 [Mycena filopes]|nr:hypothetical protein C8R46DRAFT_1351275 [Mycena filopes]
MLRPFSALPTELLDLIAVNASRPNLLTLSRTNRKVYAVCLRQIYPESSPVDARAVVLFFRTMISNKLAASYVLKLTMQSLLAPVFKAFRALARTAMSNLTSLCELESVVPQIFHAFADMHFPHLRDCMIPLSHHTPAFIRLHPKLIHLILYDAPDLSVPMSLWITPIALPDLTTFMGPHTVAPLLLRHSATALAATLTYLGHDSSAFAATLSPIAKAAPTLRVLFSVVPSWDAALPAAIAAHLPSLLTVKIRNSSPIDPEDPVSTFLLSLDAMIHALPHLRTLNIVSAAPHPLDARRAEFAHVRRWGDISPALTRVLLPSRTTWLRLPGGIWFPKGASEWFVREVACCNELPVAYLAELRGMCGSEETLKTMQTHYRALEAAG